jgi:hypothetical protein
MLRTGRLARSRPWVAGLVLGTTLLVLLAGAVPHSHVSGNADDCAVCKASHTVATLEPIAHARRTADGVADGPAPRLLVVPAFRPSSACGPRAPPTL